MKKDSSNHEEPDLYFDHAVFALEFCCEHCGKALAPPEDEEAFTDPWYQKLANMAKEAEWFVPPITEEGQDVMRAWCRECAWHLTFAGFQDETRPNKSE